MPSNRDRRNSDRPPHQRRPSAVSTTPSTTFSGHTLSTVPSDHQAPLAPYASLLAPEALASCDPQHAVYLDSQGYLVTPTGTYQGYYQATSLDPYQGYLTAPAGPEPDQDYQTDPTQFSQVYYAAPSPEDMVSSTLVAPPSPPSSQQPRHSAASGSSTKKEKKKKGRGKDHTEQPSAPPVMSWRGGGPELDYGHPLGVSREYDANSTDFGVALAGAPAYQPGADYRYPVAIADADVSDNNRHQDQDQDYGQGQER